MTIPWTVEKPEWYMTPTYNNTLTVTFEAVGLKGENCWWVCQPAYINNDVGCIIAREIAVVTSAKYKATRDG